MTGMDFQVILIAPTGQDEPAQVADLAIFG